MRPAGRLFAAFTPALRAEQGIFIGSKIALLNRPSIGEFTAAVLQDYGADVQRLCEPLERDQHHESHGRLLDLNNREDVDLVSNVARKVDVFIDYLHEQRLEAVGLEPQRMLTSNPQLILARINGFAADGPFGRRIGGDATFAAASGVMSPIGPNDHDLDLAMAEARVLTVAGRSHVVCQVAMALLERERTGKGQTAKETALGIPAPFHRFYRTADGKAVAVAVLKKSDQKKLLEILNIAHESELKTAISKWTEADLLDKCKDVCTITSAVHS
ncbi:Carnitine dehydratase [Aphelenchoides fujianensis]|nr:Carnitine dehydratase [Aphelenchoides fujianensis]